MGCLKSFSAILAIVSLLLLSSYVPCEAQLSPSYYAKTCPNVLSIIRNSIRGAVQRERRMAASIIRLIFHDCFVQGCDASILLDETPTIQSEKTALPNNNSARGFEVIEAAKAAVEAVCPGVVSCADVLAVAARDSSVLVGGPSWQVKLGRRDSTTASRALANADLPGPRSDLATLIAGFSRKGFNERELVALSGSHTIGLSRCVGFRTRIYAESGTDGAPIDPEFARLRQRECPPNENLAPLDLVTPNTFDNNYFKNLIELKGLLKSDQVLYNNASTDRIVLEYVNNPRTFASDFARAMVKMSDMDPLTGQNGIIRRVCNAV